MSAAEHPTTYDELADVLDALPLLCREKRRRRGLSLRAAAREIGCSFSTVTRFESGEGCHLQHAIVVMRWLGQADPTHPAPTSTGAGSGRDTGERVGGEDGRG
jgi:hypothetical protein